MGGTSGEQVALRRQGRLGEQASFLFNQIACSTGFGPSIAQRRQLNCSRVTRNQRIAKQNTWIKPPRPIAASPSASRVLSGNEVEFRVWAPRLARSPRSSNPGPRPPWRGSRAVILAAGATSPSGARYRFRLDDDPNTYPDPASRFQPDGPSTGPWKSLTRRRSSGRIPIGQASRFLVRSFTNCTSARSRKKARGPRPPNRLAFLKDVGISPVRGSDARGGFTGTFGWGYDGVNLFAPTRLYGRPDDFRAFVNRAHSLGLGVILDVVYNHIGPDGNYLAKFSPDYFTDRYETDWGSAINYDGPNAGPVREFFTTNAAYWIAEYHLDGLRLDATQSIFDESPQHILADIGVAARRAAGKRSIIVVNENESQESKLVRPVEQGGYGLDMLWNDDFHHSAKVAMTGRREAYYTDYLGSPQEFISAAKYGYHYQGQWYQWQKKRRGSPDVWRSARGLRDVYPKPRPDREFG